MWKPLACILGLTACAAHQAPIGAAPPVRFTGEIRTAFSGELLNSALLPVDAVGELAALQPLLDPVVHSLALGGEIQETRAFRDDSQGHWLRLHRADLTLERPGQAPVGPAPGGLAGRSFEMRTFLGGELLDVDLIEQSAGGDRSIETFDLLFPLLSPSPPSLRPNGTERHAIRWPTRMVGLRYSYSSVDAVWTYVAEEERDGRTVHHLHYEGPWEVDGRDRSRSPAVEVRGRGKSSGDVWMSEEDSWVVSHTFHWERVMEVGYPAAPAGPVIVSQTQVFSGHLERAR